MKIAGMKGILTCCITILQISMLVVGCSRNLEDLSTKNDRTMEIEQPRVVTVTAGSETSDTRTIYEPDEVNNNMDIYWKETGDRFGLYYKKQDTTWYEGQDLFTQTSRDSANRYKATFSGTTSAIGEVYALYPYTDSKHNKENILISLSPLNYGLDHLSEVGFMYAKGTIVDNSVENLSFRHKSCLLHLQDITGFSSADTMITSITVYGGAISNQSTLNLIDGTMVPEPASQISIGGDIALTTYETDKKKLSHAYITLFPTNSNGIPIHLIFTTDQGSEYTMSFIPSKEYVAGKMYRLRDREVESPMKYAWYKSKSSPYIISSARDMKELMLVVLGKAEIAQHSFEGEVVQIADGLGEMDLSPVCGETEGNWPCFDGDSRYVTGDDGFKGIFNGNGCKFKNLYCNVTNKDCVGLFSIIGTNGQINGVTVESGTLTGNNYVGGIAGFSYGNIIDCINKSTINLLSSYGGGVCGASDGNTKYVRCTNEGQINGKTSSSSIGGVLGGVYSYPSQHGGISMTGCINSGMIKVDGAGVSVGGIVGTAGIVEEDLNHYIGCCNTGEISVGEGNQVGGIIGSESGNAYIIGCYNVGNVSGEQGVGGLVGTGVKKITGCYNYSKLESTANTNIGGIVGKGLSGIEMTGDCCFVLPLGQTRPTVRIGNNSSSGGFIEKSVLIGSYQINAMNSAIKAWNTANSTFLCDYKYTTVGASEDIPLVLEKGAP